MEWGADGLSDTWKDGSRCQPGNNGVHCSRSHTMEEFFDVKAGFGNWGCVVCKSSHVGRTPSALDSDNSNANSSRSLTHHWHDAAM